MTADMRQRRCTVVTPGVALGQGRMGESSLTGIMAQSQDFSKILGCLGYRLLRPTESLAIRISARSVWSETPGATASLRSSRG